MTLSTSFLAHTLPYVIKSSLNFRFFPREVSVRPDSMATRQRDGSQQSRSQAKVTGKAGNFLINAAATLAGGVVGAAAGATVGVAGGATYGSIYSKRLISSDSSVGARYEKGSPSEPVRKHARPNLPRPPLPGTTKGHPYENLVLAGGGAKGELYGGVAAALADAGILPHIRRFAGASAGALIAALLAIGLDADQLREEMNVDLLTYIADNSGEGRNIASVGAFLALPRSLGMHPANKLHAHIGYIFDKYVRDADLTFHDLYERFGVELAIMVSPPPPNSPP